MIKNHWRGIYGVLVTRSDNTTFLASGKDTPIYLTFMREKAVEFARSLEDVLGSPCAPVQMEATFQQIRRPSRRGMKA